MEDNNSTKRKYDTSDREAGIVMHIVRLVFILVIACCVYAIFRYYKLWKSTGLSPIIFILIELALTGTMVFSAFNLGKLNDNWAVPILQFISAFQFVTVIYSAIIFLVRDIIALISFIVKNSKGFRVALYSPKFAGIVLILLSIMAIVGFINMGVIRRNDFTINIAKKADVSSIDLAIVSDLHVGTGVQVSDISSMVEKINAMNCDAVLIVGDIMDNNTPDCAYEVLAAELAKLTAPKGVFFSYGNHDEVNGKMTRALNAAKVRILADRAVDLEGITLLGRKDGWGSGVKAMSDYDLDLTKPIIVMNHQPRDLNTIAEAGVDITFSGHTHGEQFPMGYFLNVPNNDNNYGIKKFGNMISFVTCGVGGWGFRFKFPSPAEIAKVTINFTGNQ